MRTSVAPSATATSRSSLIPIEHTDRPRRSTIARTVPNPGRAASGPPCVGPTVISPATSRPWACGSLDQCVDVPDRAAALAGLPARVDLHQDAQPGHPLGQLVDQRRAVDRLDDVDEADELADLVGLQLTDEVHGDIDLAGSGPCGPCGPGRPELGDDLPGEVLPDGAQAGVAGGEHLVSAERLGDRQDLDIPAPRGGDPRADQREAAGNLT